MPALIQSLTTEPLLIPDRVGRVQPRLAEKWEWLNDGTVLRLTLPPSVTFHDGTPLDAALIAGMLRERFRRVDRVSYGSVREVLAVNSTTVDIRLSRPEAFLPEDIIDITIVRGKNRTIGTGPFMVDSGEPTSVRAFEGYRHGRPEVDRVDVKRYDSLRGAWAGMMRRDINMLYEVSRDAADFVEVESSVRTYKFLRAFYIYVAFNVRHPVLRRPEVRQALSAAVDREAIVREAMRGRGEPADSPIWKYHWANSAAPRTHRYNPDAARLRLDAAGYAASQSSAPGTMPSRFRFTCLMFGNDPRFELTALVLQRQLYEIGVDMQIQSVRLEELVERMRTGDFDAFLLEMNSGRLLTWLHKTWRSKPTYNPGDANTGYTAADRSLDRLRHATTDGETREAIADLQRVFYEDPPGLFLAWPQVSRAVNVDIEVPAAADMDIFARIARFRRVTVAQR